MKEETPDRPAIIFPPPLIFIAFLGMGFLLEYIYSLRLYSWPLMPPIIIGGILILASGLLALGAFRVLIKNRTPFNPAKPTVKLVREGPFRICRNPMYLALLILFFGVATLTGSVWLFLAIPVLFLTLDIGVVRPEEKYLARKFGDDYQDYRLKVRRWL
jgi:protein-S-isoprenylcysteine O-methyltransferase Ste14